MTPTRSELDTRAQRRLRSTIALQQLEIDALRAALAEQVRWHRALSEMVASGVTSLGTIRASRAALAAHGDTLERAA